jgi:predicted O-methyltransferase YrrM
MPNEKQQIGPNTDLDLEAWLDLGAWAKFDGNWPVHYVLYYLAKLLKARETMEIGIGRGHGTYMLGLHAREAGGRHAAVDVAQTPVNRAVMIRDAFGLPVDILRGDSKAIVWTTRLDLCYVDGGHSYEQVVGDIENFSRWIRRNGLMIFDDYRKKHLEVTQAVDDKHDPDQFEMMVWPFCWWAIWRRK